MRYLITGGSGFIGRHLSATLLGRGADITSISRSGGATPHQGQQTFQCDLTEDIDGIRQIVSRVRPDITIHLAATSVPTAGRETPWFMLRDNLLGILSLLTVFRELSVNGVIVVVSSSAVYGEHPTHRLPLVEDDLLAPLVTYGVSKLAVEALALQHFRAYGIRIIIVRPFNVTGPGEPAWFVTSAFAQQIALIESGRRDPLLKVGDLETVRDFTDVRDAAEALTELAEAGEPGQVYNLCSGVGVPVDQVLSLLMQESGLNVSVSQDPGRLRPVEIRTQIGSPAKMLRTISWRPRYCLRRTLRDVLDYWRFRVHENNSGVPGSKC